jgi:hypothetical protein
LNFENTLNISLAFLAVPSRSLRREMIWFSTLATRSLYAFSAVTQISVPSVARFHQQQDAFKGGKWAYRRTRQGHLSAS